MRLLNLNTYFPACQLEIGYNHFMSDRCRIGMTLMETLIVITILILLAAASLILLDPKRQIEKSWDTRRKHDLATLSRVFEDFYNDRSRYPDPNEVCFDESQEKDGICYCHVCGSVRNNFRSYLPRLYCDPQHPGSDYLYQFECGEDHQNFRICTVLSGERARLPDRYHYGVASPNLSPEQCLSYSLAGGLASPLPTATPTLAQPTNTPTPAPAAPASTPTPTQTLPPTPTLDPVFTQYYCAISGCKPCDTRGNDCLDRTDKCQGRLRQFATEEKCIESRYDPVNGCACVP